MASDFDHDPFTAKPSPYAASGNYLESAYIGPPRPEALPLTSLSLVLGMVALALVSIVGLDAVFRLFDGALVRVARLFLIPAALIAVAAIFAGHIGYVRAERGKFSGQGRAVAGFLCGYAALIIAFVVVVLSASAPAVPGLV